MDVTVQYTRMFMWRWEGNKHRISLTKAIAQNKNKYFIKNIASFHFLSKIW